VTAFVDTSAFYAATDRGDSSHERAKTLIAEEAALVTSDHVLVETWFLLRSRGGRAAAELFWQGLRSGVARVESVLSADLDRAWEIGESFPDQDFSLVDRTSFALMQRIGVATAISFDDDFAIYRFGRSRERAFEVRR